MLEQLGQKVRHEIYELNSIKMILETTNDEKQSEQKVEKYKDEKENDCIDVAKHYQKRIIIQKLRVKLSRKTQLLICADKRN